MKLLHHYFLGSTLSLVFFIVTVFLLDTTGFFLSTNNFILGFSLNVLVLLSIPFVYFTTLLTFLAYLLLLKYFPKWNYVFHCLISGIICSFLYGMFFFETMFSNWLQIPLCYVVIVSAIIFSLGKYIPFKPYIRLFYFFPFLMGLISVFYPLLSSLFN